jgi:hypothetical protein
MPLAAAACTFGCGLDWTVGPVEDRASEGVGARPATSTGDPTADGGSTAVTGTTASSGAGGGGGSNGAAVSAAVTSTGSGPVICDSGAVTCDACLDCTLTEDCNGPVDACYADQACADLDNCLYRCSPTDADCADYCYDVHYAGFYLYDEALRCMYCACPQGCAAYQAEWSCAP